MKIVIVIPTYNEVQNIGRMIDVLGQVLPRITGHEMHLLVVDGNSTDGTAELVYQKAQALPWVHLLNEKEKSGIGSAYYLGFKYAMDTLNADAVVEMDADFQHDPNELSGLIAPLEEGYDYVIGSRFAKGGSIPKEWGIHRKFVSIGGNIFTKIVLGIKDINDFSTGYKVSRVKGFLDQIDFSKMITKSFPYKTELIYRMYKLNARIKQVPITFGLRDRGNSKMELNNFFESLRLVLTLKFNENKEFFKFCIVGFAGLFTDAGIFNILPLLNVVPNVAALISGFIAMVVTFLLNNNWSFGSRKIVSVQQQLKTFVVYAGSSLIPIIIRSKLIDITVQNFGKNVLVYNAAFFIGVLFGLIWNYVVYSKILWKKKTL